MMIAKLDRLARNVAFIANLPEAGGEIAAADMPEANRFLLHSVRPRCRSDAHRLGGRRVDGCRHRFGRRRVGAGA